MFKVKSVEEEDLYPVFYSFLGEETKVYLVYVSFSYTLVTFLLIEIYKPCLVAKHASQD